MKRCIVVSASFLTALFVVGILFSVDNWRETKKGDHRNVQMTMQPQCAHWSIYRSCQLLGVPVTLGQIVKLLPPSPHGHSFAEVTKALDCLGINTKGCVDNWDSLLHSQFPCIVHLNKPDHFVVVTAIGLTRGSVHIFDGNGLRTRVTRQQLEQRWDGATLHLQHETETKDSRKYQQLASGPHIRFDYLLLDKGDIPAVGKPVEYCFPFRNNGHTSLLINQVKVNCGCLKSEKPDKPILPGEMGTVKLFYEVEPKDGPFMQTALVMTNCDNNKHVVLTACGYAGVKVYVHPYQLQLENVLVGRDCQACCYLKYTGERKDFHVDIDSSPLINAKLIKQECLPISLQLVQAMTAGLSHPDNVLVKQGNITHLLRLRLRPTGTVGDRVEGNIVVKTNVPGYEQYVVHISGEIESPIQPFPKIIFFENVTSAEYVSAIVVLAARLDESYHIVAIQDNNHVLSANYPHDELNGRTEITFTTTGDKARQYNGTKVYVQLHIDDANQDILLPLPIVVSEKK